jgi:hypothetical protein
MPIDPQTGEYYTDGQFGGLDPLTRPGDPDANGPPPAADVQPDRLTPAGQVALAAAQQVGLLAQGALGGLAAVGGVVASNRLAGVQTTTRAQRAASGFQTGNGRQPDMGCKGKRGECQVGKRKTQLYPASRIPPAFKLTHMAVKGYHLVYWRTTQIATFTRKKSANLFCRAFNEALSHLGSAQTFDIPTLAALFAAVIDGGSGQWGLTNGFDPPLHGANGTPQDTTPVLA